MKKLLPILAVLLVLPAAASAENHYVTQSGGGDGSSPGSPWSVDDFNNAANWNTAANIDDGHIGPGDTVFFSGTITITIETQGSGTAGNPITLDGYAPDDTTYMDLTEAPGRALIDTNGVGSYGIYVNANAFITVQDFEITDVGGIGVGFRNTSPNGKIRRCFIHDFGGTAIHTDEQSINTIIGGSLGQGNVLKNVGLNTADEQIALASDHTITSYNHIYCTPTPVDGEGKQIWGADAILVTHDTAYHLIEYNTIHGHNRPDSGEDGIDFKPGTHDTIVRYNNIYDHKYQSPVDFSGDPYNIYIYGNRLWDSERAGVFAHASDGGASGDIYAFSNIIFDNNIYGIMMGEDYNFWSFNNILAENGDDPGSSFNTGIYSDHASAEKNKIYNTLFYKSRPNMNDYVQLYVKNLVEERTLSDYNIYYWPSQASRIKWGDAGVLTLSQIQAGSAHGLPQETHSQETDPGLANIANNDYRIASVDSAAVDAGTPVGSGAIATLNIAGTEYSVCWDIALDPATDWTTIPPTVVTVGDPGDGNPCDDSGRNLYGWDIGAYVYTGGATQTCSDGTPYDMCVPGSPPRYCDSSGQLVDSCGPPGNCGCPSGQTCSGGTCYQPPDPDLIPQDGWILLYADSEETSGEDGSATNSFDGNPATYWHTSWSGDPDPAHPHEIQISLGGTYNIRGFRYLPRQDGGENGMIGSYEFYVSSDGSNWGSPAYQGSFTSSTSEQEAAFQPVTGSFVRLVSLSEVNGNPWTSAAEINVLGDPASQGGLEVTNFVVSSANSYEIVGTGISAGDLLYTDRDYVFTVIPSNLEGETFIRTANDDKNIQSDSFLSFDVDRKAEVFIGYRDSISPVTPWLGTWTHAGYTITATNCDTCGDQSFDVYQKEFSAGTVTLGGNAGGTESMYIVFVIPVAHRADTSGDGCVDQTELLAFINLWYQDSTTYPMGELMEAVALWKSGTGC